MVSFSAVGAGSDNELLYPRDTVRVHLTLHGAVGSKLDIVTGWTPEALTRTLALLALDVLPGGTTIAKNVDLVKGLIDSETVSGLRSAAQSCGDQIAAAIQAPQTSSLTASWRCLFGDSGFLTVVTDLYNKVAIKLGLDVAAHSTLWVALVLDSAAMVRLMAELWGFRPSPASFSYPLLRSTGLWQAAGSIDPARFMLAAARGGDGRIYVLGGGTSRADARPEVEAYNPATGQATAVAPLPGPNYQLAAVGASRTDASMRSAARIGPRA